jgi:hypothetical protein
MRGQQRQHDHDDNVAATARERIVEIGAILARGLVRLQARQSSQLTRATGESSLASLAHQSGHENHGDVENRR